MSTKLRLEEDMKQAMREREVGKFRLSVIRMVRSSIKNAEINERRELGEEDVLGILAKEVKMRKDAFEEFTKAQRQDLADQAQKEIQILQSYLPAQLTLDELELLVKEAIAATGSANAKEMGKVMAYLNPKVKGRADGKQVSELVKKMLS